MAKSTNASNVKNTTASNAVVSGTTSYPVKIIRKVETLTRPNRLSWNLLAVPNSSNAHSAKNGLNALLVAII